MELKWLKLRNLPYREPFVKAYLANVKLAKEREKLITLLKRE